MREFAQRHGITNYFEIGRMGIEHCLLPELGLVLPGDVVIGADSHTCTYGALGAFATGVGSTDMAAAMATGEAWFRVPATLRLIYYGKPRPWVSGKDLILHTIGRIGVDGARYMAMEFAGETVAGLSQDGRFTMANMAIEAGAKNGVFIPDAITDEYVKARSAFLQVLHQLCRCGLCRHYRNQCQRNRTASGFSSSTRKHPGISDVADVTIDQVVIGSCNNGRMEDLEVAASILAGRQVASHVRLIIFPAPRQFTGKPCGKGSWISLSLQSSGEYPTCGPCLGGHMGVLAKGERALATTNRNCGTYGTSGKRSLLKQPAVAAASAIAGRITSPEAIMGKGAWDERQLKGKIWVFGDDIDTDAIIPARHLNTSVLGNWRCTVWRMPILLLPRKWVREIS